MSNHPLFHTLSSACRTATLLGEALEQGIDVTEGGIIYTYRSTPTLYHALKGKVRMAAPVSEPTPGYVVASKTFSGKIRSYFCSQAQFGSRGIRTKLSPPVEGLYLIPGGKGSFQHLGIAQEASVQLLAALFKMDSNLAYHCSTYLFHHHRYEDIRTLAKDYGLLDRINFWHLETYLQESLPRSNYRELLLLLEELRPEELGKLLRNDVKMVPKILGNLSGCTVEEDIYFFSMDNIMDLVRALLAIPIDSLFWNAPMIEWPDLLNIVPQLEGRTTKTARS